MNEKQDLELAENVAKLSGQVQYFREYATECQNRAIEFRRETDEIRFLLIALMVKNHINGFDIPLDFLPKLERYIGAGVDLVRKRTPTGWEVKFVFANTKEEQ